MVNQERPANSSPILDSIQQNVQFSCIDRWPFLRKTKGKRRLALSFERYTGGVMAAPLSTPLPFEPPNEHVCVALFHPEKNAWWLVLCTHHWEERNPWEKAIKDTHGTLVCHHVAASYVRSPGNWAGLLTRVREQMKSGFVVAAGGPEHVQASGTRWLRSDPELWWQMHSASTAQLETIKSCAKGSELLLGALVKQGHFGFKNGTPGHRGPSIVENRWRTIFPNEMAFADQCQSLGVNPYEVLNLWKSAFTKNDVLIESKELGDLLGVPDLR